MSVAVADRAMWADTHAKLAASPALGPLPNTTAGPLLPPTPIQQRRRRGFVAEQDNGLAAVQLVEDEGVLRWSYEPPLQRRAGGRRSWRAGSRAASDVVQRYEFPELGDNQITQALEGLDKQLNDERGLRKWVSDSGSPFGAGAWQTVTDDELKTLEGPVLLLLHGTFSKASMYDSELLAEPAAGPVAGGTPGQRLWGRWALGDDGGYAAVLAFEHATLSVAPWLNALMLAQSLSALSPKARLHLLCHSRGGLVASWALRISPLPIEQIVFVGSPLMGTSLAAPNRLRVALDLLANVANAVSVTSVGLAAAFPPAAPLSLGAAGLARVLGRTLQLGAAVPLADAVVGLVPGLMSQSRVANNLELKELALHRSRVKLRGIGVVFKPEEVGVPAWKFWKRFSNLGAQAGYYIGDLVFQQANDLVVDFDSMNQLGPKDPVTDLSPRLPDIDWKTLGERSDTHHCSYFRNPEVIAQLDAWLR